ncbi:hypothetical protein FHG87_025555, partial [Trinorchestia longiramus]
YQPRRRKPPKSLAGLMESQEGTALQYRMPSLLSSTPSGMGSYSSVPSGGAVQLHNPASLHPHAAPPTPPRTPQNPLLAG